MYDDARGVGEPLNERSDIFPEGLVVRGRLLLSLDRPASAADAYRPLAQGVVLQPLLSFTDGELHPNTKLEVSEKDRAHECSIISQDVIEWQYNVDENTINT